MGKAHPRHIFEDYERCVLCICVELPSGDKAAGTGFHVGGGWVVTAKHVLDGNKLDRVVGSYGEVTSLGVIPASEADVDLALIKTDFELDHYMKHHSFHGDDRRNKAKTDHIPLGFHLDDWVGSEFILSRVVLFGFPRIPTSARRDLVVVQGEVNAIVDKHKGGSPYFIISPQPRPGFSGGPVFSEYGFLLGVLVESLTENDRDAELGFSAVLSIEPLLHLLASNNIRPPGFEDEHWDLVAGRYESEKLGAPDQIPKRNTMPAVSDM